MKLSTLYKRTSSGKVQEWTVSIEETNKKTGVIVTRFGLVGGKIQELREEIKEGKNIGKKNETTPYFQALAEAEALWDKQKNRKGYGLDPDGEESANIRSSSPMLAKVFNKEVKKVQWDTAFAQPKLDGFRCLARKVKGKVVLTSRENQPFHALEHIEHVLSSFLKEGITLDGEMYKHGMALNKVSSACKRKSSLSELIEYHIYDIISDDDFGIRHTDLYSLFTKPSYESGIILVETVKVRNESDLMTCQKEFLEQGYEGAMLRHSKVGYEAGKRSSSLLKCKTFVDEIFKVIDWKLGRGKYEGVPIWTCETDEGHVFDVLSAGTIEEKKALGEDAEKHIGKMLKVKFAYMTKTEESVPFQPVAIGFEE